MPLISIDPVKDIESIIQLHKIDQWALLLIQLSYSFWLSLAFTCGGALTVHRPPWEAFGEGLVAGSTYAVVLWRRSPLTKGLMLVLPEKEAEVEMQTNLQVIQK